MDMDKNNADYMEIDDDSNNPIMTISSNNNNEAVLVHVPQEVLFYALTFLNVPTLVEKKQVCRKWRIQCTKIIQNKRTPETAKVFETTQELRDVVKEYTGRTYQEQKHGHRINHPCSTKDAEEIACTYGYPIGTWDVSHLDDFSWIFCSKQDYLSSCSDKECYDLPYTTIITFNEDINSWDTSNAKTMEGMFANAQSFNRDISNLNVSKVTNMSYMFAKAKCFNQRVDKLLDNSQVKTMVDMFKDATSFQQNFNIHHKPGQWIRC